MIGPNIKGGDYKAIKNDMKKIADMDLRRCWIDIKTGQYLRIFRFEVRDNEVIIKSNQRYNAVHIIVWRVQG